MTPARSLGLLALATALAAGETVDASIRCPSATAADDIFVFEQKFDVEKKKKVVVHKTRLPKCLGCQA